MRRGAPRSCSMGMRSRWATCRGDGFAEELLMSRFARYQLLVHLAALVPLAWLVYGARGQPVGQPYPGHRAAHGPLCHAAADGLVELHAPAHPVRLAAPAALAAAAGTLYVATRCSTSSRSLASITGST